MLSVLGIWVSGRGELPERHGEIIRRRLKRPHDTAEPVRTYADLPPGVADASVIAAAGPLNLTDAATWDRRHFTVAHPNHPGALNLLPSLCGPRHRAPQPATPTLPRARAAVRC